MDYVEKEALSIPEAVFSAARALGIDEKDAQVQVLSAPGARRVKVRVGIPGAVMPAADAPSAGVSHEAPAGSGHAEAREERPERSERPDREPRRDYAAGRSDFSSPAPVRNAPSQAQAQSAKADLEKLLGLMATPGQVELKERAGNTVLNIVSPAHESILIGRRGQTAEALQHLVLEMMQRREKDAALYLVVDVADYHGRAEERLIEKARSLAAKVLAEGGEESMGPLSSAERRVVHVELKPMDGIETFSVGNSSTKKLIIKRKG
jgi:spoIIIJ-associated protein